ncbi:MAG: thioredoxin domain-containing protein [Acidobacteriota bacterium]|nr:MAG: thioredoxin domain-containing protein [Acidobacteriota bacterium]
MANRLAAERSPYLLQHADNPVDWYPWGTEAFERARREDKPIFLSIGYSTCHWCHVMAHESFEDPATAALLNDRFVSIKVDREERPDVDRIYMTFIQATTGAGGWPMSVWLTPELKPFFGGTYFPPTARWGRPGLRDVLARIADVWENERETVVASADRILEGLREASGTDPSPESAPVAALDAVDAGIEELAVAYDARYGGFGGAPKFPRPSELLFLLDAHAVTGRDDARDMALETLRAMSRGGLRDQLGGGFHRYSVDAGWRVPHFEKMLYDQAQIALALLTAWSVSADDFFALIAADTLEYVRRELTAPSGAFYSAEDADSPAPGEEGAHGREGACYLWTRAEVEDLLGDDAPLVCRFYGIEADGNALVDPGGELKGRNVLYIASSTEDLLRVSGRPLDEVAAVLTRARNVLLAARATRPRPHLDDKIITAWNGLAIAAFSRAARVLVDDERRVAWLENAGRAADWLQEHMWRPGERRLFRRHRDGESAIEAGCEDYAALVWGLLELFQATGEPRWLEWAIELTRSQMQLFFDPRDGGWFATTGEDPSLLLRIKEDYDGAEPSAASMTVRNLITLGRLTGDPEFDDYAGRTLERYGPHIGRAVRVMPLMVANLAAWHGGDTQVVIAGGDGEARRSFERVLARRHVPWATSVVLPSAGTAASLAALLPWTGAMWPESGARVYVCDNFTCQAPDVDPAALERTLDAQVDQARQRRR